MRANFLDKHFSELLDYLQIIGHLRNTAGIKPSLTWIDLHETIFQYGNIIHCDAETLNLFIHQMSSGRVDIFYVDLISS